MLQQLQEAGEELQEGEIDSVLQRCEQLSTQLREALRLGEHDRYCFVEQSHKLENTAAC